MSAIYKRLISESILSFCFTKLTTVTYLSNPSCIQRCLHFPDRLNHLMVPSIATVLRTAITLAFDFHLTRFLWDRAEDRRSYVIVRNELDKRVRDRSARGFVEFWHSARLEWKLGIWLATDETEVSETWLARLKLETLPLREAWIGINSSVPRCLPNINWPTLSRIW